MKKPLACILCLALLCCVCSLGVCAAEQKTNYLLLGDSITEGFGVANPSEASYGKIVADTNNYNYKNDATFIIK